MKPFSKELAKQGHPIGTSRRNVIYVAGPDVRGVVVIECDGELTLLPVEALCMKPLCQVEGRDVYPGDVLYDRLSNKWLATPEGAEMGDSIRKVSTPFICSQSLSWIPPKKKEVVSLWQKDKDGEIVCNAMKSPFAARRVRAIEITPEGDVVVEIPE